MRGFPPELIYFLIFIAIFLFQFLKKIAARQAEQEAPPEVVRPPRVAYPTSFEFPDVPEAAPATWSASPPLSPTEFGRRRPPAPVVARPRRQRRYSRQALFGTPQDVRKAVVIATILGPCRALESSDAGAPTERASKATSG
jgi:hypothetical protein